MLIAVLVFLVLRQVMPIASGLAGGASLNSFGLTSRLVGSALRPTPKVAKAAFLLAGKGVGKLRARREKAGSSTNGKAEHGTDTLGSNWRDMRP